MVFTICINYYTKKSVFFFDIYFLLLEWIDFEQLKIEKIITKIYIKSIFFQLKVGILRNIFEDKNCFCTIKVKKIGVELVYKFPNLLKNVANYENYIK